MGKRREKTRSMRTILLLLLLSAILLIASSYAWFTANQVVTIEELEVNVAAQNGLQISADGSQWSALLNTDDLVTAGTTYKDILINQIPTSMAPVSTAGNVDATGRMDMFYGTQDANSPTSAYRLWASKETEANGTTGKFIAFDMFLRVEAASDIELTANSNVVAKGASKGIENAARVAFVVQGTLPAGSDLTTIQKQNGGTTSTKYIWEPNYDAHTPAAITTAIGTYGTTLGDYGLSETPTTNVTGANQLAYDGIKAEIPEIPDSEDGYIYMPDTNATDNSTYFQAVNIDYKTTKSFGTEGDPVQAQQIFSLAAGITKIRVYMWIEGQDIDCENTASGTDILYNIQIARKTT